MRNIENNIVEEITKNISFYGAGINQNYVPRPRTDKAPSFNPLTISEYFTNWINKEEHQEVSNILTDLTIFIYSNSSEGVNKYINAITQIIETKNNQELKGFFEKNPEIASYINQIIPELAEVKDAWKKELRNLKKKYQEKKEDHLKPQIFQSRSDKSLKLEDIRPFEDAIKNSYKRKVKPSKRKRITEKDFIKSLEKHLTADLVILEKDEKSIFKFIKGEITEEVYNSLIANSPKFNDELTKLLKLLDQGNSIENVKEYFEQKNLKDRFDKIYKKADKTQKAEVKIKNEAYRKANRKVKHNIDNIIFNIENNKLDAGETPWIEAMIAKDYVSDKENRRYISATKKPIKKFIDNFIMEVKIAMGDNYEKLMGTSKFRKELRNAIDQFTTKLINNETLSTSAQLVRKEVQEFQILHYLKPNLNNKIEEIYGERKLQKNQNNIKNIIGDISAIINHYKSNITSKDYAENIANKLSDLVVGIINKKGFESKTFVELTKFILKTTPDLLANDKVDLTKFIETALKRENRQAIHSGLKHKDQDSLLSIMQKLTAQSKEGFSFTAPIPKKPDTIIEHAKSEISVHLSEAEISYGSEAEIPEATISSASNHNDLEFNNSEEEAVDFVESMKAILDLNKKHNFFSKKELARTAKEQHVENPNQDAQTVFLEALINIIEKSDIEDQKKQYINNILDDLKPLILENNLEQNRAKVGIEKQ